MRKYLWSWAGQNVFTTTWKTQFIKKKDGKLGLIKISNFFSIKILLTEWKDKPHMGRKYLQVTFCQGLVSIVCKELLKLNKKMNNLI